MDVPVPHVVEIILDVHVPKATDETTEVVKHIPKERVQNYKRGECHFHRFARKDEFPVMSLNNHRHSRPTRDWCWQPAERREPSVRGRTFNDKGQQSLA